MTTRVIGMTQCDGDQACENRRCLLRAGSADYVLPTATLSGRKVTGHADSSAHVTLTAYQGKETELDNRLKK